MSETGAKPAGRKNKKRILKFLLWLTLAGLLLLLGLGWYTTTDAFRDLVRGRLVAMLEQMTGGRVELGSLHTVPFHFQMEVRDLTIHGREQPGDVPYAHVNSLMAQNPGCRLGALPLIDGAWCVAVEADGGDSTLGERNSLGGGRGPVGQQRAGLAPRATRA